MKQNLSPLQGVLYVEVYPKNFNGEKQYFSFKVNCKSEEENLYLNFKVKNPRLWWPNDTGEQALYNMNLSFIPREGRTAQVTASFGTVLFR